MLINKKWRVAVLIACHNEEATIQETIFSVLTQTVKPTQIVCVDDASTDETYQKLIKLKKTISTLQVLRCQKNLFRAAALNLGLKKIGRSADFILTMDADTVLSPSLLKEGLLFFQKYETAGAVCSRALLKPGKGLLYQLQKLEYGAGFDGERTASFENVMVLHGMCTLFKREVFEKVGFFAEGHLIEDYDMTVRLKKAGFCAMFNPRMQAFTTPPGNLKTLLRQRLRWSRGGIDVLRDHGLNKWTFEDMVDHWLFIILMLIMIVIVVTSIFSIFIWSYKPHPIALLLGISTYLIHLYRLKFIDDLDFKDILLRIIILPELIISMFFSGVQIYAYILAFTDRKKRW